MDYFQTFSFSAFHALKEGMAKQKQNSARFARSKSFGGSEQEKLELSIQTKMIENENRRILYGTLPFVAAFGMQHRENSIRRVISNCSTEMLDKMDQAHSEVNFTSDVSAD